MRIALCALVVLASASTASAQIVRHGTLRAADAALLTAQGGAAARHWFVDAQAPSGAVTRLVGAVPLRGATTEERVADFLARYGAIFDAAPGAVELSAPRTLHTGRTTGNAFVHLEQTVHGLRVVNGGLRLEITPDGRALCVHGIVSAAAAALPAPSVSTAQAIAIADAELAARGHVAAEWQNGPHLIGGFVDPLGRAGRPFWRIGAVPRAGVPLAVDVDALDGRVLAVFENAERFGEGAFIQNGGFLLFKTGNGKGTVYKDFNAAAADLPSTISLPELAKEDVVPVIGENGSLFGRFSLVLNQSHAAQETEAFTVPSPNANHQFLGFPGDDTDLADLFDATNCYFHLAKYGLGMTKLNGQLLPTDFAMPTLVNSGFHADGANNAFFSADDWGVGTGQGYMLYGDDSTHAGYGPNDDLARDPTVMCHEYTHAIAAFSGLDFGSDQLDSPPRAVNEAIADYFAGSFFKDPRIGFPYAQICSQKEFDDFGLSADHGLRDMSEPRTFIDDLFDFVDVNGFPEEHEAGRIFGCTLWHVREVLKQKAADDLIFDSLFNWPQSLGEVGHPDYTPDDAAQAYADYYAACLTQLSVDAAGKKGPKGLMKALGAVMQNGALGCIETGEGLAFDGTTGGSATISSAFLGSSDGHLIGLQLAAGQSFDLTLTGDKKDGTLVDVAFDGPAPLSFPNDPIPVANGFKLKGVQVTADGIYGIEILNAGPKTSVPQKYTLKVKIKG